MQWVSAFFFSPTWASSYTLWVFVLAWRKKKRKTEKRREEYDSRFFFHRGYIFLHAANGAGSRGSNHLQREPCNCGWCSRNGIQWANEQTDATEHGEENERRFEIRDRMPRAWLTPLPPFPSPVKPESTTD